MSHVAKVFVVLNLLLSVAFLVFSMNVWTARTKWQKMYEEEKTKTMEILAHTQKHEIGLAQEVVRAQEASKSQNETQTQLKFQYNTERDKNLELQTKLAVAENARDIKDAEIQELSREVKRAYEDVSKLKSVVIKQQQAVVVERDNAQKARNEKAEMENELSVSRQSLSSLQRDKQQAESDLALQTSRVEGLISRGVPVADLLNEAEGGVQPHIADAQVLAVRPDVGLVMLSVGSQQSVKPGYRFVISRGDEFIAKVQVDKVYPDMSSAKIVPGFQKKDIQIHDEARSN